MFSEQEAESSRQIKAASSVEESAQVERERSSDVLARIDEVLAVLSKLSIEEVWSEATERERRVLVEELVETVALFPDHLEVTIAGAPKMNITLQEVGLTGGLSTRRTNLPTTASGVVLR